MTRRERYIVLRATALVLGLVGGGLFLVAPLWTKAGELAARRRVLVNDEARVDSEWAAFAAQLTTQGAVAPLERATLPDSTLARLLTHHALPPPNGLHRAVDAMPRFLTRLGEIGQSHGIDWSGARTLSTGMITATLPSGEALPVTQVSLEITGHGPFSALGRALRALGSSDIPVRIRTLKLESSGTDEVSALLTLDLYGAP